MVEGDAGLLDDDVTEVGDMFHDQDSAVIMRLIRQVQYTPFAMSKSWEKIHTYSFASLYSNRRSRKNHHRDLPHLKLHSTDIRAFPLSEC